MSFFTAFLKQMYKANTYTYIKGHNVIIFYEVLHDFEVKISTLFLVIKKIELSDI